ncbi:MAG: hypothetical protein ACMXYK_03680 [Candidatus Woesearchaeota archaeon]
MSKRSDRRKKAKSKKAPAQKQEQVKSISLEKNYRLLLILPIVLIIFAIAQISMQMATTGDFVLKGVSLSGGVSLTIDGDYGMHFRELESQLMTQFPDEDIQVREISSAGFVQGFLIESTTDNASALSSVVQDVLGAPQEAISVEIMGASLGEQFFRQTFTALIVAFILMGIVVFIQFKHPMASFIVILSAFFDIVVTAAIINVLGIRLSTAGVAAFLMLIGYSVDTDILLTNKVLKDKGTFTEKYKDALKTGLVMTATTLAAVAAAMIVTESVVIQQILLIVFIGLIVDAISTWMQNASLLRLVIK